MKRVLLSSISALTTLLIPMHMTMAASFFSSCPDDPKAVYLTAEAFGVKADGKADDSDALQAAINKVQETTRKGIVLIPEGKYRITRTIRVWNGIRLIGYGKNRPVIVLGEKTPGFQEFAPNGGVPMIHYVSDRPRDAGGAVREANPGTFYSAFSNIDIEIADGNPAAVGIRSHWAQHCFIAHADFRLGNAYAGVQQVGNEMEDCRFFGGDFAIVTTKPSPSWPYSLVDSTFEGQKKAAIETQEGGMSIVRCGFSKMPTAILVRENRAEELVMQDCILRDISSPAILVSDVANGRSQTNLTNLYCENVPTLVKLRETGQTTAGPSPMYRVESFTHGNQIAGFDAAPRVQTTSKLSPLAKTDVLVVNVASDIPALPAVDTWVSVFNYGAKGDGVADDTEALKKAIAENKAVYFPTGRYKVTDTIKMKDDTALIALSPQSVQIFMPDGLQGFNLRERRWNEDAPPGNPQDSWKPMIESSKGGSNILFGIGLDSGNNTAAIACKWMAGEKSYVNDVKFVGGHGTYKADGSGVPAYNRNRTADGDPNRAWDSCPYSLWITDNGGGTFKDIWTANPIAKAGFCVENTKTSGRMYAISVEHHVSNEVIFRNVSNFQVFALQTEEERAESPKCLPLEVTNCENLQFNNFYFYRINLPQPKIAGIEIKGSRNLTFRGLHTYSPGKTTYDNAVMSLDTGEYLRSREIALLTLADTAATRPIKKEAYTGWGLPVDAPFLADEAMLERVANGYENIDSLAADPAGNVYYLESSAQKIYRHDAASGKVAALTNIPADTVGLVFDTAGNLLTFSWRGDIHTLKADALASAVRTSIPRSAWTRLAPTTMPSTMPATAKAYVHPGTRWKDAHDFLAVTQQLGNTSPMPQSGRPVDRPVTPPRMFTCPDGVTLIPETRDLTRAYSLIRAVPGKPCYIADEFGQKTYRFTVAADGRLTKPELIAEEGEAGVVADSKGNVYTAAGEILVYDPAGKPIGQIKVPERPTSICLGGKSGKTLFIAARTSLYAIELKD